MDAAHLDDLDDNEVAHAAIDIEADASHNNINNDNDNENNSNAIINGADRSNRSDNATPPSAMRAPRASFSPTQTRQPFAQSSSSSNNNNNADASSSSAYPEKKHHANSSQTKNPQEPPMNDRSPSASAVQAVRRLSTFQGASIDYDLAVPAQKELVFWSFSQLLQKFIEGLDAHIDNDIPSALNWLVTSFNKHPLLEPHFIYTRILIFWALRRLNTAVIAHSQQNKAQTEKCDTVIDLIKTCLALEPINEFLPVIMIDVTPWLVEHDGKIIFVDEYNGVVGDYETQEMFVHAWNDLFRQPFVTPNPEEQKRILKMIHDPHTSIGAYNHILKTITTLVTRLQCLQRRMESPEPIITHPQIKAMKLKIDWLIRMILDTVEQYPPSRHVLKAMTDMTNEVMMVFDPDPFSGMRDAAETFRLALGRVFGQLSEEDGPRIPKIECKHDTFMDFMLSKYYEEDQKRLGLDPDIVSQPLSRAQSVASSFDVTKDPMLSSTGFCGDDLLVMMDDIWLEIDPVVDRIVIPSIEADNEVKNQHVSADEILSSVASGLLHLTRTHLMWHGVDTKLVRKGVIKNPTASAALRELAVIFPLCDIRRFTIVKIHKPMEVVVGGAGAGLREREPFFSGQNNGMATASLNGMNPNLRSDNDSEFLSPKQQETDQQQPFSLQHQPDEFYLSVFTDEEVYKFFPLNANEVGPLRQLITGLTGLVPFSESDFIKNVLSQKLSMKRHEVLKSMLQEPNPWIDNSADLNAVISALTNEHQPQHIVDLERLFHSCRIEAEVTKEAILILRRIWYDSPSEATKIKVLSIVGRLLDKVVIQKRDPIFVVVHRWLRNLEQSIIPYRSPTALALVSDLVRRCKAMILDPLTPIVQFHAKTRFARWDDYNYWLAMYSIRVNADDIMHK